jgi:hypothetical protein
MITIYANGKYNKFNKISHPGTNIYEQYIRVVQQRMTYFLLCGHSERFHIAAEKLGTISLTRC